MAWGPAGVLKHRNARIYLAGVLVSGFGDSAMSLAAGVWVKELTGSNALAALVTFCAWAPAMAGPFIGTLADRVRRRPLLIATSLGLAAVMTAPLAVRSSTDVWVLFAVLTLVGAGSVLMDAAEAALITSAIPEESRGDFNGLVRTVVESTGLVGPLAGAGLFVLLGGPAAAVLDALTFLLAAVAFSLIRVREPVPARAARTNWARETADGVRHLWDHSTLRPLVAAGGCAMAASGLSSAANYALVDEGLHRPAAFIGVLATVQGVGSASGGLAAGALLRRMSARTVSALGLALFAAGVLARATGFLPLVLAGGLLVGLGLPWPLISAMTSVQRETPGELLGRVAATAGTLVFGPTGCALLLGTVLVTVFDHRVQLLVAAVLSLATAARLLLARGERTVKDPRGGPVTAPAPSPE
ncbi:MFS transporter [Streptomyces sp. NBC_00102]|uniref:MFS transporter n=1 Tax=Streptomyces sp. NBC_00102 TaxID=2975652 RepID=UPI00224FF335|nr:MFS transporter [Streptomyces sp. NBC_00102]MCX5401240.1 MFS transporter [Streptomyces sp. NBC_00102]